MDDNQSIYNSQDDIHPLVTSTPVEVSCRPATVDPMSSNYRHMLLVWAREHCQDYPGVYINDFTHSWRNGRAFLVILHRHTFVCLSRLSMNEFVHVEYVVF
jgi:hypothetical protein